MRPQIVEWGVVVVVRADPESIDRLLLDVIWKRVDGPAKVRIGPVD